MYQSRSKLDATKKKAKVSLSRFNSRNSLEKPQPDSVDGDDDRGLQKDYQPYLLKDVLAASSRKLFTVVSTFAGGGGSSTGYRLAGGKVIFANEFIEEAVRSYEANYPDTPVVFDDIRKLNRGREAVEKLFAKYGVKKRELDIFDGSPPCATFSRASGGKGKAKMEKKNVKYSDTTQDRVGMLIHDYVFMANVIQPKVCVIENVPDIATSPVFEQAMERLRRYDYVVSFTKLIATHYGVPQKRERLFVLAVRPDIAKKAGIRSATDLEKVFPARLSKDLTVRQALNGVEVNRAEREMLLSETRRGASYEIVRKLPLNPTKNIKIRNVDPSWRSDFSISRVAWDRPCPTITASGAQGRGGCYHPDENRIFTIAELKRLAGLPDDFKLSGTFHQKAERIGRMVPPLMTKAIATAVYNKLLKNEQ